MEKLPFEGDPPIPSTAKSEFRLRLSTDTDFVGLYTTTGGAEFGPPHSVGPVDPLGHCDMPQLDFCSLAIPL